MRCFLISVFVVISALFAQADDSARAGASRRVIVIPISGDVDAGMAAFIARAIRENTHGENPLFVIEMDTFGGRVDAAFQIVDTLLNVRDATTVAFVKNKAISAGALIALACNQLVMKNSTTIGDCAPIAMSNEGPKMLGEKFQSPLRAKFRTMAKRNGYSETLAESMVTAEMMVFRIEFPDTVVYIDSLDLADMSRADQKRIVSKKTVVASGELLTMDDREAHEYGFSRMSAGSIEEMLARMGIGTDELTRIEESWSESFVRFIGTIAPILMMIGFAALYTEMRSPGFGVPGIVGVICLALVFTSQYLVGLADYTELLLIVLGGVLLAVEVFITPGFGVLGIAGLMVMAAGMVLSLQGFVIPKPEMPWQRELLERNILTVLASLMGSFVLIILFFRYGLPRLGKLLPGPYLSATLAGSHVDSGITVSVAVGDKGVVTKPLRPSGSARIGGRVVDVVTEGEFVDTGVAIQVIQISGNRVVVSEEASNE